MISPEILESARPETVKLTWPGIFDIDEAQAGGCPEFWNRYFPGEDPRSILDECRHRPNWEMFWGRICPAGRLRFVVTGVYGEDEPQARDEAEDVSGCASGEEGDFVVLLLKEVIRGRLASDDPSFFLRSGSDMFLIWPFRQEATP